MSPAEPARAAAPEPARAPQRTPTRDPGRVRGPARAGVGATAVAPARPRPAGRPAPGRPGPGRPPLRVVDEHARKRRQRWRRLGILGIVVTLTGVFAALTLHVFVVQSQFQLDDLHDRVSDAQARYERDRLQVAQLAAPERIVSAAQGMGMVTPSTVTFLTTPPGAPVATGTAAAGDATDPDVGTDPAAGFGAGDPTVADGATTTATTVPGDDGSAPPPGDGAATSWSDNKELLVPGP